VLGLVVNKYFQLDDDLFSFGLMAGRLPSVSPD
jgi:hypothetical protein